MPKKSEKKHKKKVIEEKLEETTDKRKRKSKNKEDVTSMDNYEITEKTKQILKAKGITALFPI